MPAYHSSLNSIDCKHIAGISLLPFKSKIRGSAPSPMDNSQDIIDESIALFRANCFFRNFEIKGDADRTLIYCILFISDCLGKISKNHSSSEATKILTTHALGAFSIPGEAGFTLNALYGTPAQRSEGDVLRGYLSHLRQEIGARMIEVLYADGATVPSKWWMSFQKRKFMNKSL